MIDPIQAFLQANAISTPAFPPESRYHGLPIATFTMPDGTTVAYVRRRFVPRPEQFAIAGEHRIVSGDRPDNLAARYVGDAQRYWLICDANRAMRPDELVEIIGRAIAIPLPEGVPGAPDAD
jgi:hypothetical protein